MNRMIPNKIPKLCSPSLRTTKKVLRYEAGRDDRVSHISSFAYSGCKPCCTRRVFEV